MLLTKNTTITIITISYLAFFIKYVCTGFSMRWLVNTNIETAKYAYYSLICNDKSNDHTFNMQNLSNAYVSFLVGFGANTTGKNAIDVECSGALVTSSLFITAAHCFYKPEGGKKSLDTLRAVAGVKEISKYRYWRQFRHIIKAFIHQDYIPLTFINDIAVAQVDAAFYIGNGVDIVYFYVPYTYYEEDMADYWRMCTAVGFWKRSGIDEVDVECVRQIHPNSCNYSSGIRGAICVGPNREPFKEQGSPLVCYNKYYGYTVLTAIMLTSCHDYHTNKHWPALYLRVKSYWDSNLVPLANAKG